MVILYFLSSEHPTIRWLALQLLDAIYASDTSPSEKYSSYIMFYLLSFSLNSH